MKTIQKLSDYQLRELIIMTERMLNQIEIFSHVSENFKPSIKNQLEKYFNELNNEEEHRERLETIVNEQYNNSNN